MPITRFPYVHILHRNRESPYLKYFEKLAPEVTASEGTRSKQALPPSLPLPPSLSTLSRWPSGWDTRMGSPSMWLRLTLWVTLNKSCTLQEKQFPHLSNKRAPFCVCMCHHEIGGKVGEVEFKEKGKSQVLLILCIQV